MLGQSLKPDGTAPRVLIDRARRAKALLEDGTVVKVIVSGGDPAGTGHTEASQMAAVLESVGISREHIIQESQATTTAENIWFGLRWIPRGTGQLYLVTSDFHMARAAYIVEEVLAYFYRMVEDAYRHNPDWTERRGRYPRLSLHQAEAESYCGSDPRSSADSDPAADVNMKSLALRARNELGYLQTGEVSKSLYGAPLSDMMYIWPVQINVTLNPENRANFDRALQRAESMSKRLCKCTSPPEPPERKLGFLSTSSRTIWGILMTFVRQQKPMVAGEACET